MDQLTQLNKLVPTADSLRDMRPLAKREFRSALGFIAPWIFGFLAFTLIPVIATFIFTFTDWKISTGVVAPPTFVGLKNYATLLKDGAVWSPYNSATTPGALWVTIIFGALALPVGILLPLGIAVLMNSKYLVGQNFFRSMFYMPYIIPFVASIFLWGGVLNSENGWINLILLHFGVPKASLPLWVNGTSLLTGVYPAYVILGIWGIGNAMLTMLAGMQGVPTDLYDAAKVDGATAFQSFRNVTFPMISPVIFYNLVLNVVGLFQYFLVPLVINAGTGNPGGRTMFYNLYLYKTFFGNQNMSYGSTLAWLLFMVILAVTVLIFWSARFWVYYASENP